MLGRFLEYSIPTPDIRASLDFYGKLGFSQAQVGEAWPHPYAVVTDGRMHLGLHQLATAVARTHLRQARRAATTRRPGEPRASTFEFRKLGNDVFNEVGWLDPSGHLIRLVEARTFSPIKQPRAARCADISSRSRCRYPTANSPSITGRASDSSAWTSRTPRLPHVSCTSDSIDIGLYDPAHLRLPTLVFDADDVEEALARLASSGISPSGPVPAPLRQQPAAMLVAPEGTPLPAREGLVPGGDEIELHAD